MTAIKRVFSLVVLCGLAIPITIAAACETFKPHELRSKTPRRCECGSDLERLKIHVPSGFKLYAVCNLYFKETTPITLKDSKTVYSKSISGSFYFAGDAIISGTIKEGADINRGNLYFYPNQEAVTSSYSEIGFEDSAAEKRFGAEGLSAEEHWCAPATIRIRRMYFHEWSDEARGAYALDYDVVKVGKFERCARS